MDSYIPRRLEFKIQLNTGTFDGKGDADTVVISDVRASVEIEMKGSDSFPTCTCYIYGLSQVLMERLTVYGWKTNSLSRDILQISAGSTTKDMVLIFTNEIYSAFPNYDGSPDVPFVIQGRIGFTESLKAASAISFKGTVDISVVAESIAKQLDCTLINSGVTGTVTDCYLWGTATQKLQRFKDYANIDVYYYPPNLTISPKGKPREAVGLPLISPETGLVGWPRPDGGMQWLRLTTLYNPALQHGIQVEVKSDFPTASGKWWISSMTHELESQTPGGAWFTHLELSPYRV